MKRLILLISSYFVLNSINLYSESIDLNTAVAVAKSFYYSAQSTSEISKSIGIVGFTLVHAPKAFVQKNGIKGESEEVLFYIFNIGDNKGFVIVSGDNSAKPILGYSLNGKYSEDNPPPALVNWLTGYQNEIINAKEQQISASKEIQKKWNDFINKAEIIPPVSPVVGPLLGEITWDQGSLYNEMCPIYNSGDHTLAGCVAIAVGQIMHYHHFPNIGQNPTGQSEHSYFDPTDPVTSECSIALEEATRTIDFTDFPIDWANIPTFINEETTQDQINAIAQFVVNVGFSVNMDYGPCASASSIYSALSSFLNIYGYDTDINIQWRQDFATDNEWITLLQSEINAGRPLYYQGVDPTPNLSAGHAFVCDGFDSDNNFHFNWGWGGGESGVNGYYALNALDPSLNFSQNHRVITLIKLPPDVHEPNNGVSSAKILNNDLNNISSIVIEENGNIDVINDDDYYALNLPLGYDYDISARVYDITNNHQDIFYSANVNIQYNSNDTWSSTYDFQTSEFRVSNGGVVYFKISGDKVPAMYSTGTYRIEITCTKNYSHLASGKATPSQEVRTGEDITFSVNYIDSNNLPPSEISVSVDGFSFPMTKNPSDDNYTDGVEYTYTLSLVTAKIYSYYFRGSSNDGTTLTPYPESGSLNFVVYENPEGWDLRVTNITSNLTYMLTGQGVLFSGTIHNNSSSPEKVYSDIFYKFELFSPLGTLIDQASGTVSSLSQLASIEVSGTLYTQSTTGNYNCLLTIFPLTDEVSTNNSISKTVVVGLDGPSEEYFIAVGDAWVELNSTVTHYDFNSHRYYLTYVGGTYIEVIQDESTAKRINVGNFREYNSQTDVLICEAVNTVGDLAAYISFGKENTGYITFDETNITCHEGDDIFFTARCSNCSFTTSTAYIYNNETVEGWHEYVQTYDGNLRATYEFNIPSGTSSGVYSFWIGTALGNDSKFLRELTITVIPSPPVISTLSKTNLSADDQITITGTDFGTSGTVQFGTNVASASDWSSTSIKCIVPQGITNDVVTVTTTDGTSNGIAYTVISSTGIPIVIYEIPDQTIKPGETRFIASLNDVYYDPNGGSLQYTATSDNPNLTIDQIQLSVGNLLLIASESLLTNTNITITATDDASKSVSDFFIVIVPNILMISPLSSYVTFSSGTTTFSVTSNIDWSVSEDAVWLTAAKLDQNTLTITYDENTTSINRSAIISLSGAGVVTQTVMINQQNALIEHTIDIANGWNIISSIVQPSNISIGSVLSPLIQNGSLIKLQDEAGRAIEYLDFYEDWFFGFDEFQYTEGYKIRVNSDVILNISGLKVPLPLEISLSTGWNIISFPAETPQDPSIVFSSLMESGILKKVMDESGNAMEYNPDINDWIQEIAELVPGKGYKVSVTQNSSVQVTNQGSGKSLAESEGLDKPNHFVPSWIGKGFDHMNFYFLSGSGLNPGDEIAVFDGQLCVGITVINEPTDNYVSLIAIADDPVTIEKDGFKDGNLYSFVLWDNDQNKEYTVINPFILEEYPRVFSKLKSAIINLKFDNLISGIYNHEYNSTWLGDAYPNPSDDNTIFTFKLAKESRVKLEIFRITGELVNVILEGNAAEGLHKIEWDNCTNNGNHVAPGLYYYRFICGDLIQTRGLIIQ